LISVATIVGARPQFIKSALVSRAIAQEKEMREVLIHTGQHYDRNMSSIFFEELEIRPPDFNLNVGPGLHGAQTGQMMESLERVLLEVQPDLVLVYGDTNSTMAGALVAAKMNVRVAHVEAGLRSFNRAMPEEINRVVVDHISDLLFAPTNVAVVNLKREGLDADAIHLVGDVMYDAMRFYTQLATQKSHILEELGLKEQTYVLATVHRAENTDTPLRLKAILNGLGKVSKKVKVVLPLHPRTKSRVAAQKITFSRWKNLQVIDAVGYLDMIQLERNAAVIATDSGGVQKEAYFHQVPCVTMRETTEWLELVDVGANHLVAPVDAKSVEKAILTALQQCGWKENHSLYGDEGVANRVTAVLAKVA